MNENLTSKTFHGLKWSYFSTIVNALLQIGFTAIMARLLEPAAFGLIAMAGVVLRFGAYFAQMGVGQALIQKAELTQEEIRAAFTSSALLGVAFSLLTYLIAPLGLLIFDVPEVVPVIRWMGFSFLFTGLSTTAVSLLRRKLDFRSLAIIEIVSYVIGYGLIGVAFASVGFGVWSLVAATLSQNILTMALSYLFNRHRVSLIFGWKFYKPLYSFGSRISFISFFEFIGSNLDTIAIGHFLGPASLGIYNRAFMLVTLPLYYFTTSFSKVLFPAFSKIQLELERLKNAYLSSITLTAAIVIPTCIGIMVAAQEIVLVLLGPKWTAAIPVLRILSLAVPMSMLLHFGGVLCDATANLNKKFMLQLNYVVMLAILFFLFRRYGVIGFATAVVIGELVRNVAYLLLMRRILSSSYKELFLAHKPGLINGFSIGAAIFLATEALHGAGSPIWLTFSIQLILGSFLIVFLTLVKPQKRLREEIRRRLVSLPIPKDKDIRISKLFRWYE